jgi:predicted signal transduction protein with EAL and GGDEF domain
MMLSSGFLYRYLSKYLWWETAFWIVAAAVLALIANFVAWFSGIQPSFRAMTAELAIVGVAVLVALVVLRRRKPEN